MRPFPRSSWSSAGIIHGEPQRRRSVPRWSADFGGVGPLQLVGLRAQGLGHLDLGYSAWAVLCNLGSKPAVVPGLVVGTEGYCPPDQQHPRVLVAGDLKGARMQRIAVAMGDGARAALEPYYRAQALLG
ncbi:hypothetical protein [Streptomyces abikoensis]|uniref:Uncharacterized protein n=1 Tax=Streptomyces abikoensis TaxID=97398 RepID=A0ABW7TCQ2_9ACTN